MRYGNKRLKARCPICSNTSAKLLYETTAEKSATHFAVTTNADRSVISQLSEHITNLWKSDTAQILTCESCLFTYADPFIAGDHGFYNLISHGEAGIEGPWKWEFEVTRKALLQNAPMDKWLLEVGASTGDFIKRIAGDIVKKSQVVCTEYSETGVRELTKLGIKATSADIRSFLNNKEYEKKFHFVCLFQVLEHLDNYEALFQTFNFITTVNAHIYIAVPNGRRIAFNEKNKGLLDLPPNHVGRFNPSSISQLAKKFGWRVNILRIQEQSYHQILGEILYYQSLQRRVTGNHPTLLKRWKDYIDINLMKLEIARKKTELGDNLWIDLVKVE